MSTLNRSQLSDIRGAARMALEGTEVPAEGVEKVHRTIQMRAGPLGVADADRTRGITGFVYRCVRGGIRLAGRAIDASLAPVIASLPEGESSPLRDAYRSAANGVYGDYLVRTGNPLAIDMGLRYRGQTVDPRDPMSVLEQHGGVGSAGKLLVLVHGSCMNDRHWNRDGHDHGAALAGDLGYLPLYLRYNSGLNIARNGRLLAELLETLIGNCTTPVEEIAIIGHSMGGLTVREYIHSPYYDGDIETNVEEFGEQLTRRFNQFCEEYGRSLTLAFEPGKFLVSEAGYFLVKVNAIKQTTSTVFAQIDSGFNHFIRPMLYGSQHQILNISNPNGKERFYSVVGYICETDTFANNRRISEINPGDILAFRNAGAYCFNMSSNYNSRFRPAEVLWHIGSSHLIRKRESFDDLMRNQIAIDLV